MPWDHLLYEVLLEFAVFSRVTTGLVPREDVSDNLRIHTVQIELNPALRAARSKAKRGIKLHPCAECKVVQVRMKFCSNRCKQADKYRRKKANDQEKQRRKAKRDSKALRLARRSSDPTHIERMLDAAGFDTESGDPGS